MHKTGFLLLIVLLCSGCSLGSQIRGSGNVTTEQRTVGAFSAIDSMKPQVSFRRIPQVTFTVTVKDLTQLTLSGAARVNVRNLSGDKLTVDHSGAGSVSVAGTVNEQRVTLSGVGNYDGVALTSDQATVVVSGVGNAVVNVRQQLDATVSGVGGIEYIGSPQVQQQISGVGTVRQRTP